MKMDRGFAITSARDGTLAALPSTGSPGGRRPLLVLALLALAFSAAGCQMALRVKDGGISCRPVAVSDEVDAVADHLAEETQAIRAEFQAADAQLRADMNAADEQTRHDAAAARDAGHAAYEAALAEGKSALEAERAKWETAVKTAIDLAAVAKQAGENATKLAGDAASKASAEAGARESAFRELLAQIQSSKLDPKAFAEILKDPIAALTDAAKSNTPTPVEKWGPPGALLAALLGTGEAARRRSKRTQDMIAAPRPRPGTAVAPPLPPIALT